MKKTLRVLVAALMVVLILASIGWYLFIYDRQFTRDTLLQQARYHDMHGNSRISAAMYDFAYVFSDQDEDVAIELANQYKSDGNYTKAEYTLTAALKNNPTDDLYVALCRAYVEQDKLLDAVNLLDNIGNPQLKAQLDSMRPSAPVSDYADGYYSQYMDIHLSSSGKYIFYTDDGDYPSTTGKVYQNGISLSTGETYIYAIGVGENGLVSPLTVMSYTITGVIEPVTFTDPSMEAALRQMVGADSDDIVYTNQLWDITEFEAPDGVTTFADLALLPYLQSLTIQDQKVDTLKHLSSLELLKNVNLSRSTFPVEDLRVLAQLPALTHLDLSYCELSTIAELAGSQTISHLNLNNNTIRNLEPLTSIPSLVELDLSSNAVVSLSALSPLGNLSKLLLNYNAITSLDALASCIKLAHVEVDHNQLTALNGIEKLPLLTHLSADYNTISNIYLLKDRVELTNLSIASNKITDITCLYPLVNLQVFDFSGNTVETLPEWPENCALQTIDGSYNALTNIDVLKNMKHLTHVYMDYNLLTNIDALAQNFCLVQVNVYGNEIPDVEALRDHDIIVNYNPTVSK